MSDNVRSHGFIAVLSNPILDAEAREELSERLYDEATGLHVNYEGTLVYSDDNATASYDQRTNIYGLHLQGEVGKRMDPMAQVEKAGLSIVGSTIRTYDCIWYNGSDSDMAELSKEEFLRRTKQA